MSSSSPSSAAVSKASAKKVAPPSQQGKLESSESSTSASASAGLNLNLAGAVAGLFSSKSKKETGADGGLTEEREDKAHVKGAGAGSLNADAAASAEQKGRQMRAEIEDGKGSD